MKVAITYILIVISPATQLSWKLRIINMNQNVVKITDDKLQQRLHSTRIISKKYYLPYT